ncbi:MAG TPA: hypothetical protein VL400_08815, partial [Polyangiaceae bacterium]|nr:hypothetical protein [Polyangiaceae bacterium]
MSTHIESVAVAAARRGPFRSGVLHLSDAAAETCLRRASKGADELDLLVNAGIYRDKNLAEPAFAAIIQEDIGANLGHPPKKAHHGTFSFDVNEGGSGVLAAAEIIDGFVGAGSARLGMVVAGDTDPNRRAPAGVHFATVGGAMLLSHADDGDGFQRFEFHTFPDGQGLFTSRLEWEPHGGFLGRGRNVVDIHEEPLFTARAVERAGAVTRGFLQRVALEPDDVDLLIASPYPERFALDLVLAVGLHQDTLPPVPPRLRRAHTAGPLAALAAAIDSGAF